MKQFYSKFMLQFKIPIPTHPQIEKSDSSKYNCQSLDSTSD